MPYYVHGVSEAPICGARQVPRCPRLAQALPWQGQLVVRRSHYGYNARSFFLLLHAGGFSLKLSSHKPNCGKLDARGKERGQPLPWLRLWPPTSRVALWQSTAPYADPFRQPQNAAQTPGSGGGISEQGHGKRRQSRWQWLKSVAQRMLHRPKLLP
jgi:hypothetical protein